MARYMPPQFNHRTDKGSGGTDVTCMTNEQKRLRKWWATYDADTLALMLLNHMTAVEQMKFSSLYQTLAPFRKIEVE